MEGIAILLVLGLLTGSVLGWVAFFKMLTLKKQVFDLQHSLRNLNTLATNPQSADEQVESPDRETTPVSRKESPPATSENTWTGEIEVKNRESEPMDGHDSVEQLSPTAPSVISRLKDQWMIWLGGISIGLSGIFMVRYSIEQGLLGPLARILLSVFAGIILHAVAEWARRRNYEQYQAVAALAGGASIMLYAALLASLNLYNLFPAPMVFIALIFVSLATMVLAVLHGPVLAILGILGAYVIPALVDTGSSNVASLYAYSTIITAAALLLMRYVYRPWLWSGMLTGALGWLLITLETVQGYGIRGFYIATLTYLLFALPSWDWLLRKPSASQLATQNGPDSNSTKSPIEKLLHLEFPQKMSQAPGILTISLMILAFGITVLAEQRVDWALYQWTPIVVVLLIAAGNKPEMLKLVAASLVVQCLAWLALGLDSNNGLQLVGLAESDQSDFMIYAAWMAFLYTALSLRNILTSPNKNFCCAIAVASPLVWLSLCYLLVTDLSESIYWGAAAVGLGLFYLMLAAWRMRLNRIGPQSERGETEQEFIAVWLILAGHFSYSLAVAIMVREAGLTLVLSAQILSIAWLIHRFNPPRLHLLMKLVLAVVIMRLTLNPWILTYPADVHWSLWTYGGATVFAALGAWRLKDHADLRQWLELASLHLLVLTLWAETRYYIYDGNIFTQRLEFIEFSINTAVWLALSLVYFLRHRVSQNLKPLYLLCSKFLLVLGLGSYTLVLFILNPYWSGEDISSTPIFNILLLSYALPVVIGGLLYKYYDDTLRGKLGIFTAIATFAFINIEIRHLWSGQLSASTLTSSGELYTYTIIWLIIAIACLLAGSIRFGTTVYRAGFGLLMMVIAKIFLLDMADLEGLLRVASFMGLGLSLLGLAYLYQRFNLEPDKPREKAEGI